MMIKNSNKQENCYIFLVSNFWFPVDFLNLFEFLWPKKMPTGKIKAKIHLEKHDWITNLITYYWQNECARENAFVAGNEGRGKLERGVAAGGWSDVGRHLSNVACWNIMCNKNVAHSRSFPAIANDNIAEARYKKIYMNLTKLTIIFNYSTINYDLKRKRNVFLSCFSTIKCCVGLL